jgi:hypothetical protein
MRKVNDAIWLLKTNEKSSELGPVPLDDVRLWWKFHVLPEETLVRPQGGDYQQVKENPTHFPIAIQVHMVDPTVINDVSM